MNDNEQQIAELEQQIKDSQESKDLGKALANLRQNPDFKKLIIKGYLENEAVRLVHLKADPEMQSGPSQAAIDRDINAIGTLSQYFRVISMMGSRAESSIAEAEQMIVDIQEEKE